MFTASAPMAKKIVRLSPAARSQALRRGLDVLCLFTDARRAWGVSELAGHLGEHKSIIHRTLKTLEDVGFLQQDPVSRQYSLGFTAYQLGVLAARQFGFTGEIRAKIQRLSETIAATVYVVVRDGDANRIVDTFETSALIRFHSPVGTRIPWSRGASSRVLLAYAKPDEVQGMIARLGLVRHARRTIVDPAAFMAELEQTRKRGYAISDNEGFDGILGLAAPIFAPSGALLAALQSSMPAGGLSERRRGEIARAITATAKEVTALLQGAPVPGHQAATRHSRRGAISAPEPPSRPPKP
ncbi:MAG: IclR family transcriptional regulator [Variibacter sp.]|nr:IclR family transcriptional regulator [Variibacter sp.]